MRTGARKGHASDWTGKTLFGKWTVERLIGVGGTSTVLQARHRNGRRAALKILHQHLVAHGHTRERFLREGRLANLVDHPGVVAVLDDFVTEDGTAVLVLELVQGQNLAARAKEHGGVLPPREVVDAARAVLEVLAVAHDAGLIHRDVKPENILVATSGGYKLTDFGLAGLCHELGVLTGTNASLGTPAYMSPEQARGDALAVDARTDLYGLGAAMFTLLTGRFLHSSSSAKNLVVAAATEKAPPLLSVDPSIQPDLAEIVDRALCSDREERWPNARVMLAALSAIVPRDAAPRAARPMEGAGGATASTSPSSILSWVRPRPRLGRVEQPSGRPWVWPLFGTASVAVVAAAVWTQWSADRTTARAAPSAVAPPPSVPHREPERVPSSPALTVPSVSGPERAAPAVKLASPRPVRPKPSAEVASAPAAVTDDELLDRRK